MKNIMIVSALILSMAGISTAQADPQWRGQNNQGDYRADQRVDHRGDNHDNDQGRRYDHDDRDDRGQRYDHHRNHHYGWNGQRYHAPTRYMRPHGYEVRTWRNGDRLPSTYRTRQYAVDYRQYHLNPPPRGYQYVRVNNNDVVLTAIATGIIASVITGLYY